MRRKHDSFCAHKKVKELTGPQKRRQISVLKVKDGKYITVVEEKIKIWTNYIRPI